MQSLSNAIVGEAIVDEDEQRREEWFQQRAGKITASHFGDLMKPGRSKDEDFTVKGYSYLRMKIAERLGSWHSIGSASMDWGNENEATAIEAYNERVGSNVEPNHFGFVEYNADIGGTPDALCGDDGCLEVKCPYNPAVHVKTLLSNSIPDEYRHQVAGHLLVTHRKWCDFVSFDPRIEGPKRLVVIRYECDEAELAHMHNRLMLAVLWIEEQMKRVAE